ncbi:MAG: LysR family transcriptional regulator [Bradyrhizobiaceae bacterium]|nr:MAG: LysR family transcriptional regulator [Bradyrhizobiaceae bacterium]
MAPTFNQLRYFCEVATTGNFGRAAARLHISQPPLSRQIAALERSLGTRLFERTAKGVTLTVAGQHFLTDARDILRSVEQAQRNAAAAERGEAGQLTVGFTMCAAYSIVPQLTRRFAKAFPKVDLRVRESMPNELESDLRDGAIDIAISFSSTTAVQFETCQLWREPLELVLPDSSPVARARKVKVESLAGERFLIVPRSEAPSLHDSIVQRCRAAGFDPLIGLEVYLQQTIVNFVAEGLGVAFVPASMRRSRIEGAVFRPVSDPPMVDQVLFWSASNRNPCVANFIATSKSASRSFAF